MNTISLDCSGLNCPLPILRLSKAVGSISPGDRVEMIATDPGSTSDMDAWTKKTGHALLASEREPALLDRLFAALDNRHRRGMVELLALQPWSISRLARARGLSLPAMDKHVRILEAAGLVRRRKTGRTFPGRPRRANRPWRVPAG